MYAVPAGIARSPFVVSIFRDYLSRIDVVHSPHWDIAVLCVALVGEEISQLARSHTEWAQEICRRAWQERAASGLEAWDPARGTPRRVERITYCE